MTKDAGRPVAAMQGGGFYNRNSEAQKANLTSALPLLEAAAGLVPIDGSGAVVIADYGASQGRNSLRPMRAAIEVLRTRADVPVEVVHADLPSNDFASLFVMLAEDPESYLAGTEGVFPAAIGRSYFAPIFPAGRVSLGWSANAIHWLSRNPVEVVDHMCGVFSESAEVRETIDRQLDEDWRAFLRARAFELRDGGRLVCQFMGRGPESHGFEYVSGKLWDAVVEMGGEGLLRAEERVRMTTPSAGRSGAQIGAPFEGGAFAGLRLEYFEMVRAPDPYWDRYCESGDAQQLGRGWADMMRAVHGPMIGAALAPGRDAPAVLDDLFDRLAGRIAADPRRSESYNALVVVAKG